VHFIFFEALQACFMGRPLSKFDAVGIQKSTAGRIKAPKERFMKSAMADFIWGLTKDPIEWKMDLP